MDSASPKCQKLPGCIYAFEKEPNQSPRRNAGEPSAFERFSRVRARPVWLTSSRSAKKHSMKEHFKWAILAYVSGGLALVLLALVVASFFLGGTWGARATCTLVAVGMGYIAMSLFEVGAAHRKKTEPSRKK